VTVLEVNEKLKRISLSMKKNTPKAVKKPNKEAAAAPNFSIEDLKSRFK
jgi:ribosomal protein S1